MLIECVGTELMVSAPPRPLPPSLQHTPADNQAVDDGRTRGQDLHILRRQV